MKEATRDVLEKELVQYCAHKCPHREKTYYDGLKCEELRCPRWIEMNCVYYETSGIDNCPFLQSMDVCINCQCSEFVRRLQVDGVIR